MIIWYGVLPHTFIFSRSHICQADDGAKFVGIIAMSKAIRRRLNLVAEFSIRG